MKIKRILTILSTIVIAGIISGFSTVMLNHEYFAINKIIINNTEIIPQQIIKEKLSKYIGKNIFKLNPTELSIHLIKDIPQFNSVIVKKKLPNSLLINIKERIPRINITTTTVNYIVDENGYVLNTPSANPLDNSILPVFKVRDLSIENHRIDPLVMSAVNDIHISIDKIFRPELLQVNLTEPENIEIFADDLLLIKIGSTSRIAEKKNSLLVLLKHIEGKWDSIEYIDIKAATRPAIKYKKE